MRKLAIIGVAIMLVLSGCGSAPAGEQNRTNGGSTGGEATSLQPDDLESALPTRRSLSRDYVEIGSIVRAPSDRSADMKNESTLQWYRRTYRNTADSGGPLLITMGIKQYETTVAAEDAVETVTTDSPNSEQTVEEVTVRDDLRLTQISSQNQVGNYVTTAVYRKENVVFKVQAIDPDQTYADQTQTLLSKMVASVNSQS